MPSTCSIGFTWALYQTCRISVSAQTYRLRIRALKIFPGESDAEFWLSWGTSLEESRFSHSYRILSWTNQTLSHIPLLSQYCVISEINFKCTSCVALMMQTDSPKHWESRPTYFVLVRENAWLGGRQSWVQIPASLCGSGQSLVPLNFLLLFNTLRVTLPLLTGVKEKLSLRQKQKQKIQGCIFINFWQEHPSAVLSFPQGFKDVRKKSKF